MDCDSRVLLYPTSSGTVDVLAGRDPSVGSHSIGSADIDRLVVDNIAGVDPCIGDFERDFRMEKPVLLVSVCAEGVSGNISAAGFRLRCRMQPDIDVIVRLAHDVRCC